VRVKSVGGITLGSVRPKTIVRVLIAISFMTAPGAGVLLAAPAANAQVVIDGSSADDDIVGTPRGDRIHALDGDDEVSARDGYDSVWGGRGDDIIRLGSRGGWANGGDGNDTIFGGNDFSGGVIFEELYGGAGRDELIGGSDRDFIGMYAGPDSANGRAGNDYIVLAHGVDDARGGPGNDRFEVLADGRRDAIACGPGKDAVVFYDVREAHDRVTAACEIRRVVLGP
jgi:Ca2+-binding RTX toxin-like protein